MAAGDEDRERGSTMVSSVECAVRCVCLGPNASCVASGEYSAAAAPSMQAPRPRRCRPAAPHRVQLTDHASSFEPLSRRCLRSCVGAGIEGEGHAVAGVRSHALARASTARCHAAIDRQLFTPGCAAPLSLRRPRVARGPEAWAEGGGTRGAAWGVNGGRRTAPPERMPRAPPRTSHQRDVRAVRPMRSHDTPLAMRAMPAARSSHSRHHPSSPSFDDASRSRATRWRRRERGRRPPG